MYIKGGRWEKENDGKSKSYSTPPRSRIIAMCLSFLSFQLTMNELVRRKRMEQYYKYT